MNTIIQHLYKNMSSTSAWGRMAYSLKRVTSATLYWYIFLVSGIFIVFIGVIISISSFFTIPEGVSSESAHSTNEVVIIDTKKLTEAINIYKIKGAVFKQIQATAPSLIDPGR